MSDRTADDLLQRQADKLRNLMQQVAELAGPLADAGFYVDVKLQEINANVASKKFRPVVDIQRLQRL